MRDPDTTIMVSFQIHCRSAVRRLKLQYLKRGHHVLKPVDHAVGWNHTEYEGERSKRVLETTSIVSNNTLTFGLS